MKPSTRSSSPAISKVMVCLAHARSPGAEDLGRLGELVEFLGPELDLDQGHFPVEKLLPREVVDLEHVAELLPPVPVTFLTSLSCPSTTSVSREVSNRVGLADGHALDVDVGLLEYPTICARIPGRFFTSPEMVCFKGVSSR